MPTETDELLLKQLPHSVEAEQAVLGSMLIDPRCVSEVIDKLRTDDFYIRQNKEIYETIYTMFNYSLTIDPVTVLENMKQNGYYDENQSRGYILQLMDTTPTAANVGEYIDIIKDKTLLRRVAEAAGDLTAMIQEGTATAQEALEAAEQRIYAIRQGRGAQGLEHISSILLGVYDRLNELAASDQAVPGLSTGLPNLSSRPILCSIALASQGKSIWITKSAPCKFRPSPPVSSQSSILHSSSFWKRYMLNSNSSSSIFLLKSAIFSSPK